MAKKITEKVSIETVLDYISIENAIKKLQDYADKYGDGALIYSETWGYDGPDEYFISYERDETDEERKERLRINREAREKKAVKKAATEEKERQELERLKKKYG